MTVADTLRECHRLRKHIKAAEEEIARGPRVLKAIEKELEEQRADHKLHHDTITKLKLKQREDEGTLKQTESRLMILEGQLLGISVSKEYEAKKSEIRQANEKKAGLEEAILAVMTDLDARINAVPAVDKQWADAHAEHKQAIADANARIVSLKADVEQSKAALLEAEKGIPEKSRAQYDHLVKARGPDAIAGVKDKVCQGCRTGLSQQRLMEVQAGQYILCQSCGRILYPVVE